MRVQTWQQDQFLTPNQYQYRRKGDYYTIDGFIPSLDGQALERMPTWTGHIDFVSNFSQPYGAHYYASSNKFCFVGTSADYTPNRLGIMAIHQDDLSTDAVYEQGSTGPDELGGNHKQNLLYALGGFWWIGSDQNVYLCLSPFGGTLYTRYSDGDAIALVPARDALFLVNDSDEILRYSYSDTTFSAYYSTATPLDIQHAFHFRQDLVLFARHNDGSHAIYLVDDRPPATLKQLTRLPGQTGTFLPDETSATWSSPWAVHHDQLFFSPGLYWSSSSDAEVVPIYAFDGNSIELIDLVDAPIVPNAWGLLTWRGRLLLYFIHNSAQHIYLYHNGRFTPLLDGSYTTSNWADLYSIGGELWMPRQDSGTEGWTRLETLANGVFTSSWLDMGRPTVQKHLSHLVAVVSDAQADFKVKLEYRTESGSWTQAVETDDARHVIAENLGVDFYLLQIRITFTNDTETDPDITLESLSATYSYGR